MTRARSGKITRVVIICKRIESVDFVLIEMKRLISKLTQKKQA